METRKFTVATEGMPTPSAQVGESTLEGSSTLGQPRISLDEDQIAGIDIDSGDNVNDITSMSIAAGGDNVVVWDCNEDSDHLQSNANKHNVNEESSGPERSICDLNVDDSEIRDPSTAQTISAREWQGFSASNLSDNMNITAFASQSLIDARIDYYEETVMDAYKEFQDNPTKNEEHFANEALQYTNLLDLPERTESTAEIFDLPKSNKTFGQNVSSESGDPDFIVNNGDRMRGSSAENENIPAQIAFMSEMNNEIIQGDDEQYKEVGVTRSFLRLHPISETHKCPHVNQEIDLTVMESMHLGSQIFSNPLFLQEGNNESHNNAVVLTAIADAIENTSDVNQNKDRNNNTLVEIINNDDLILLSDSEPMLKNTDHMSVLQGATDKPCSTNLLMSAGETFDQQSGVMSPDSSDSAITNDSESQECIASFHLKFNAQNKNSWYAQESLKGLSYQDVQSIWESGELDNGPGLSSSGSKENQAETQNSTLLKINGTMPKELPTGSVDTITGTVTGNIVDEPATDFADRSLVPTSENIQGASESDATYSPYLENRLQVTECFSCPLLYSWNEQSADDLDFHQFATAEGSPEEKKELELQRNSYNSDGPPKLSLERYHSENVRRPLCNLFAEDCTSDSEEKATSTEQNESGPLVKSVQDAWTSPPSRNKHKARSIFSYCICFPAVH